MASVLATIGAGALAARWAWHKIKLRNHPYALSHMKKAATINEFHRKGVMDQASTHVFFAKLRMIKFAFGRLYPGIREPPSASVSAENEAQAREKTLTGFYLDMSRDEAREILGMSVAETQDLKLVQKKFRRLMLKNHPDIGGSAFLASKINEAKEILMGEKVPKGESVKPTNEEAEKEDDEKDDEKDRKRKKDRPNLHTYRQPKGMRDVVEDEIFGQERVLAWYRLTKGKVKLRRKIKDLY